VKEPTTRRVPSLARRRTARIFASSAGLGALSGCVVNGDQGSGDYSQGPFLDLYENCQSTTECIDAECWLVTVDYVDDTVSDALCTYQCDFDEDCDYGGYCIAVSQEPFLCFEPCFDDLDCPFGFACVADDLGYEPVCLPW
jgi:hypothetical protein